MKPIPLPHDHGPHAVLLQTGMPKHEIFEMIAELYKMMSDSNRVQLFWLLCHCEECVINLSALLNMSSPAVSHHLKLLKTAGLIISRREGKEVYYTSAGTHRCQVLHDMIESTIEVTCPVEEEAVEHKHRYDSQIEIVSQIHEFLTDDLSRRYTIEELSARFHINPTTLKNTFKTVYGQPIATYMKECRIKQAAELISHSNKSIAEIASLVGWENQSKFTQAFKESTGVLPKDYRK